MKKLEAIFLLGLFLISLVSAVEVIIVDEPNSFSGARLWVGDKDDPIYPYDIIGGGIVKFEVSHSSNDKIKVVFTKNGIILEDKELLRGPFDFSEDIMINLEEERKSNESGLDNQSEEEVVLNGDSVIIESENLIGEDKEPSTEKVTGNVISEGEEVTDNNFYFLGFGVVLGLLALFAVVKMAYVSGAKSATKVVSKMELDRRLDQLD